ncbi:glycosyltransferase family 2 protein [Patescibacteria group bacterium AH-259-L05]|nr:glycosyltransferase family 2 protein [Patescibacteria group bacterium AH-259-L05]
MSSLRIIGLIIGIIGLFLTFRIYRGLKWKKLNFLLFGLSSIVLIIISLNPNILNTITGMLSLEQAQRGRILTLLIFSIILLWFLVLYLKTRLDDYRYQFDLLVRGLGREQAERENIQKKLHDKQIIILIPAYNEEKNLQELLKEIPKTIKNKNVGVLVIDDGSSDRTSEVVKDAGYIVVRNKINRGGGAGLRLGYDIVKHSNIQTCVTMDADGQHDPREIEKLVKPILENKYDLVIGSRKLGKWEKEGHLRSIGLPIFNFIINLLLKTKITDCSSGFRAFKTRLLQSITLREDQYHTSELIIDAAKKGIKIGEVPITIRKRKYGTSKKGKDIKYGLNFAKAIIVSWWR